MNIGGAMKEQTKKFIVIILLLVSFFSLGAINLWASDTTRDNPVDTSEAVPSGVLDGMTFISDLGPEGKPRDVKDTLVFEDGHFVSKECEKRCNFPARPYFTRRVGSTIEFISETRCPDKDAKIVWRGTVDGETIKGGYHWTSKRWYWTIEREFRFEGNLLKSTVSTTESQ